MDRASWAIAGVAVVALVAFVVALAAMRKAARSNSSGGSSGGSSSGGGSGGGSSGDTQYLYTPFPWRCEAILKQYPSTAAAMQALMPSMAQVQWAQEVSGGPFAPPTSGLPTWVTSMADGSPMPPDLACKLIDGCTAGAWHQMTDSGGCFTTTPSSGGWAPCTADSGVSVAEQQAINLASFKCRLV